MLRKTHRKVGFVFFWSNFFSSCTQEERVVLETRWFLLFLCSLFSCYIVYVVHTLCGGRLHSHKAFVLEFWTRSPQIVGARQKQNHLTQKVR